MQRLNTRIVWGIGVLVMIAASACSGGSVGSPVSPSTSGTFGGSTTIRGTTNVAGASQSARQSASRASALHASTTIRVCISGTTTCADVDGAGTFELTGHFSGDIRLQFTGPQGTVILTIPHVQPGETIVVTVELNGTNGTIRILSRQGGDDDSDDDDDSSDDDSDDDD